MKSCFNGINIFFLYMIISLENVKSLLDFNYPSAISLLNQNVFIVEENGIFVYDKQLKNIIYNHSFQEESDKINNSDKLSKVVIKLKANYIICLINGKIFSYDPEGKNLLLKTETVINERNYYYPVLIPLTALNEGNNYHYIIAYFFHISDSYKLKLILYNINTFRKSNNFIKDLTLDKFEDNKFFLSKDYNFLNKGLSCEYMQCEDKNQYNYLVCFFFLWKVKNINYL